jgi:hypothetical protein
MKKKYIWLTLIALIAAGAYYGYSQYNRQNPDLSEAKADVTVTAKELTAKYSENEEAGNKLYLNKVLRVSGTLTSIEKDESGAVTLMLEGNDMLSSVSAQLDARRLADTNLVKRGQSVTINGVCTGALTDVVLIRCAVEHK